MDIIYGWFAAALIALSAITGGVGYWRGGVAATAAADVKMQKHLNEDKNAEIVRRAEIKTLERRLELAIAGSSESYEKGKRDAENLGAAVAADLSAGALRLRNRWASCESQRLSSAAATAGELDAAARDRAESAGRIVRAAAQSDAQVRGLQELLKSEREQINAQ